MANRIALLKQEEMKTWKKIEETKKRTNDITNLKKRNEEKVQKVGFIAYSGFSKGINSFTSIDYLRITAFLFRTILYFDEPINKECLIILCDKLCESKIN